MLPGQNHPYDLGSPFPLTYYTAHTMTTTRTIAMNGNKEFSVITRFADGSIGQAGPFATGEQAAAEIMLQEKFDAECDEIDSLGWDDIEPYYNVISNTTINLSEDDVPF